MNRPFFHPLRLPHSLPHGKSTLSFSNYLLVSLLFSWMNGILWAWKIIFVILLAFSVVFLDFSCVWSGCALAQVVVAVFPVKLAYSNYIIALQWTLDFRHSSFFSLFSAKLILSETNGDENGAKSREIAWLMKCRARVHLKLQPQRQLHVELDDMPLTLFIFRRSLMQRHLHHHLIMCSR